jgi:hypothetical protein
MEPGMIHSETWYSRKMIETKGEAAHGAGEFV